MRRQGHKAFQPRKIVNGCADALLLAEGNTRDCRFGETQSRVRPGKGAVTDGWEPRPERSNQPLEASLKYAAVMLWTERRQQGNRVIRRFSPEMSRNERADAVYEAEGNTQDCRFGETQLRRSGVEGQPCYTRLLHQLGRACKLHIRPTYVR